MGVENKTALFLSARTWLTNSQSKSLQRPRQVSRHTERRYRAAAKQNPTTARLSDSTFLDYTYHSVHRSSVGGELFGVYSPHSNLLS